jgi:AcrR family transcriptional regulator
MAPEDRRAALIEATVPLLYEHGPEISTKQIAAAAGVAEGTIFGVFKDKNSLVLSALLRALDPQRTIAGLADIDPALPLRERLVAATDLIQARFYQNARLMHAARHMAMTHDKDAALQMMRGREDLVDALTELIQPDAAALRRAPRPTARLLLLFAGANTFGPFGDPEHFDASEQVSLLLDGLLVRTHDGNGER